MKRKPRVLIAGLGDTGVLTAIHLARHVDVVGVSMQLYDQRPREDGSPAFGSCCSLDDLHDARRAAAALGVPHYVINFERQFDALVVDRLDYPIAQGVTLLLALAVIFANLIVDIAYAYLDPRIRYS